jgi:hypothetical protein
MTAFVAHFASSLGWPARPPRQARRHMRRVARQDNDAARLDGSEW